MKKRLLISIIFFICLVYLLYLTYRYFKKREKREITNEFSNVLNKFDEYYNTIQTKKINLPTYYINMDKYQNRRNYMENHLKKYTNGYKRIRGFNGYIIENKEKDKVDDIQFINDYPDITKAEIGCTMSHMMAIKTAYDNGDHVALILEDDTNISLVNMLDFDFSEFLEHAPNDWEILKFFYMNMDMNMNNFRNKEYKEYKYIPENPKQHSFSTVGYVINRKGMEKILNYAYSYDNNTFHIRNSQNIPSNGVADIFLYEIVNTYNVEPSIFFPNNTDFKSTIHDDHTDGHIVRSSRILKIYQEKLKIKEKTREYEKLYSMVYDYNKVSIRFPVYFINMDKNPERRHFMENQLQHSKDVYRVKGFNGYSISNLKKDKIDGITFYNDSEELTRSEIGCTLSHLIAIKTSYDRGNEIALILEDDTVVSSLTNDNQYEIISKAPKDWEIIQLYYVSTERAKDLKRFENTDYLIHDNKNHLWSTAAYLINRKGMEKIIKKACPYPNTYHISHPHGVADEYIYDMVKTYILDPSIVFTNNVSLTSTIDNDKIGMQIDRSIEILKTQSYAKNKKKEWDFLDKLVFINLDSRPDRLKQIEDELLPIIPNEKVIRFKAIQDSPGHIGCSKSHIKCLEMAMKEGWKNVLIVEDDSMWNHYKKGYSKLLDLMIKNPYFDVITLGNTEANFDKDTGRLYSGVTCTSYLVNNHYFHKLHQNFTEGLSNLLITKSIKDSKDRLPYEKKYCIDQYWKHLQEKDNWFIVNPALMIQRPGKSSIVDANHDEDVDYTSLFNL